MKYHIANDARIIFDQAIDSYHLLDSTDQPISNPFEVGRLEHLLYLKCWIDAVQWHVEDEIRHPEISPVAALTMKRRIDQLNQQRTNIVEQIDDHFMLKYRNTQILPDAGLNTESPAWALDRLSILGLKIYHMRIESVRTDASPEHMQRCQEKLAILKEQQADLCNSIDELLSNIAEGRKHMKVYRQMKMYNDPKLNPVLYNSMQNVQ